MAAEWVKQMTEDVMGPSSMVIGKIIKHPDGYKVKVIDGVLWAPGGFSNWWTWCRVGKNGKLGRRVSGYGW